MIEVQYGVPLPGINRKPKQPRRKHPVDTMEVGGFYFLPEASTKSVSAYISRITKNLPGKFTARRVWAWQDQRNNRWTLCEASAVGATEGVGVWRTE
jgi:hypothetical protein